MENLPAVKGSTDVANGKRPTEMEFPELLKSFQGEITRALPKHLTGDRMCRIALTAFRQNPKLKECKPLSVFAAIIQSAQLGLEVGLMGEAYLVPFKDECQLIPGYTGLMKLARNSGTVKDIYAHTVRHNDFFHMEYGLDRTLHHKPFMKGSFPASDVERGPIVGYYAVGVLKDGDKAFVALGVDEVIQIRNESKGYQASKKFNKKSIWDTYPEAMGLKTAIRRLCKWLPKSPEIATILELDNSSDLKGRQNLTVDDAIDGTWAPNYDAPDVIEMEVNKIAEIKTPDLNEMVTSQKEKEVSAGTKPKEPKTDVEPEKKPVTEPTKEVKSETPPVEAKHSEDHIKVFNQLAALQSELPDDFKRACMSLRLGFGPDVEYTFDQAKAIFAESQKF